MATEAQIAANRRNAEKSTGPKTDEGKAASRRNATKHGLSGVGIVLPEAEEAAIAGRLTEWAPRYGELEPHQAWALEELVRESIRIERCNREELALRARTVERARSSWDDDRRVAAETLGRRLHARPSLVTLLLERTPQGCTWKAERWESLADVLAAGQDWDDRHLALAQDLLGVVAEFRDIPCAVDLDDAGPDDLRRHRLATIAAEVERLRALAAGDLAALDAMDRGFVSDGIEIEPDRTLARLNRYMNACHRRFHAAERVLKAATKRTQSAPEPAPAAAPKRPVPASIVIPTTLPPLPPFPLPSPPRVEPASTPRPMNRRYRRAIEKQRRAAG